MTEYIINNWIEFVYWILGYSVLGVLIKLDDKDELIWIHKIIIVTFWPFVISAIIAMKLTKKKEK
jgi:hypothetical protein